jgi:hypothetical protein
MHILEQMSNNMHQFNDTRSSQIFRLTLKNDFCKIV